MNITIKDDEQKKNIIIQNQTVTKTHLPQRLRLTTEVSTCSVEKRAQKCLGKFYSDSNVKIYITVTVKTSSLSNTFSKALSFFLLSHPS